MCTRIPKLKMKTSHNHLSSFRDPSGYIFVEEGIVYRQVNASYFDKLTKLHDSGLYKKLTQAGDLVTHEITEDHESHLIIKPEQLELITYPYEWPFSQIKDAALLTLRIHLNALAHEMILKDATAFNVQFHNGKPIFIDTLSFDCYQNGDPWVAYGQFCRHFLAPLLLMKYIAPDLNKLQVSYIDGVPLETASRMLPLKTHFSPFIKTNIHLHAKAFAKHKDTFDTDKKPHLAKKTHCNIVTNMIHYIQDLKLKSETEWGDYYAITNYDTSSFNFKEETIKSWIVQYDLKKIWDIGGNNGHFSRLIQDSCDTIICSDVDPVAVDTNYRIVKKNKEQKILPLVIDFTNPPPAIGFGNEERSSFKDRVQNVQIDCLMALALIHHLSISANCTFEMLADIFTQHSEMLLIEFVAPQDSWAEKLLRSKRGARDLFVFYNKENFEAVFSKYYEFMDVRDIPNSARTLYMMKRKKQA